MRVHFFKYQATGNDFVLIENLAGKYKFSQEQIKTICDRRFGVGADGVMLIEKHASAHFNLQYFNSDGSQSLCGNGSRAAVVMAASLGLINGKATFQAFDGIHEAELKGDIVRLRMNNVTGIKAIAEDLFVDTGSPHLVRFVPSVQKYPVFEEGKSIRYAEEFSPGGTNVNFVEVIGKDSIFVRTYERGVENETLSCGTGVTAAALAASRKGITSPVNVKTLGGELRVEFRTRHSDLSAGQAGLPAEGTDPTCHQAGIFEDIYLVGPAKLVFEGDLEL